MASPLQVGKRQAKNRWTAHPMEGWDGNRDGSPSEPLLRRWKRIGESGAAIIWCEASAVMFEGRANPNQLTARKEDEPNLRLLFETAMEAHQQKFGSTDGVFMGLQLTHSGRFSRPNDKKMEPRIAFHHPLLDKKFGISPTDDSVVCTDQYLDRLVEKYVEAAIAAQNAGFHFIDAKACHGYLSHELLAAHTRPGKYGGEFEGRTLFLRSIIEGIRQACPGLQIGVRLSVFDTIPYQASADVGAPMDFTQNIPYCFGFGNDPEHPMNIELSEPIRLMQMLRDMGVTILNLTAGSPYYSPHIQRPTTMRPCDGYKPPEDPLIDVCRQIAVTRECRRAVPGIPMIGTAYTCLGKFTAHVAQAVVREGWADSIGLGRQMLAYPNLPADSLQTGTINEKGLCCTCSACTTSARNGMISGCYARDIFYKDGPNAATLRGIMGTVLEGTEM